MDEGKECGIPSPVCPDHAFFLKRYLTVGQVRYTRSSLDPLASLPNFVLHIHTALSTQRTDRLDLRSILLYTPLFLSHGFALLTTTRFLVYRKHASLQQPFGTPFQPTGLRMRTQSTSSVPTSLPIWRMWRMNKWATGVWQIKKFYQICLCVLLPCPKLKELFAKRDSKVAVLPCWSR